WMEHDALDAIAARAYGVYKQRMPSAGVFSALLSTRYFMGIARSGNYSSRQMDVKHNVQVVRAPDERTRFDFMSHIGMQGSYLEGSVLDQLFGRALQPAVSAAQILMEANARNIPIYTVTQANVNSVLPQLTVSAEVKADIAHAVNSGKQAIVPKHDLTLGNWTGTGYILQDTATGAGAYLIDGGWNGGTWKGCDIKLEPIFNIPVLKVRKDIAVWDFNKRQHELALLADKYPDQQAAADLAFDINARMLILTAIKLGLRPWIGDDGCLTAIANGKRDALYILLGQNPEKVKFTGSGITFCYGYQWTVDLHAGSTQRTFTESFSRPGKYTAKVTADCIGAKKQLSDTVIIHVARLNLTIHNPGVIDPAGSAVAEAEEMNKGAQTFVNLDNDDRDEEYDITDTDVKGEDELVRLVLELDTGKAEGSKASLKAASGGEYVRLWKADNKGVEYTPGSELTFSPGTNIELWAEGIKAHDSRRATSFSLSYGDITDEVALTVIGIERIEWKGQNNSIHHDDILDKDPNWPLYKPRAWRVFPGARASDPQKARKQVNVKVTLSVKPVEPVDFYFESFDMDDPTSDKAPLDNEQHGEDNRGEALGQESGIVCSKSGETRNLCADKFRLSFDEKEKTFEFQTSMQPGDNFRIAGNGDRDFLDDLGNFDSGGTTNADKQRITNFRMTNVPFAQREIRKPRHYAGDVLTVWRFMHVEIDSMEKPPADVHYLTGNIRNFSSVSKRATNAVEAELTDIRWHLDERYIGRLYKYILKPAEYDLGKHEWVEDKSCNLDDGKEGKGRFQNGELTAGPGTPTEKTIRPLIGNSKYRVMFARNSLLPQIFKLETRRKNKNDPVDTLDGTVTEIIQKDNAGRDFLYETDKIVDIKFNGGKIQVSGGTMADISVKQNSKGGIAEQLSIPFKLKDDDLPDDAGFSLPRAANTSLMQDSDLSVLNLWAPAYIRPVFDGGGNSLNNNMDIDFKMNIDDQIADLDVNTLIDNSRGSAGAENKNFWVVYIQSAYEPDIDSDGDPDNDKIGVTLGITGEDGSFLFLETIRDKAVIDGLGGMKAQRLFAQITVHEVGHQFHLDHPDGLLNKKLVGIMGVKPPEPNDPEVTCANLDLYGPGQALYERNLEKFSDRSLNKIRCALQSEGLEPQSLEKACYKKFGN
ncbi:MAG: hypothetical protein GY862_10935, partial [Gammaproteobacteria bacterium]|nr:hypothetical protein [Gammaproteobacteria bacterium]